MTCANCGGPLPTTHGCHGPDGHKFCDACAAIAEALLVGARTPVVLYDDGRGGAIAWTSNTPPLGRIVRRTEPRRGHLGAVRYRVRMLDGSLWYGSGPVETGTYIRLRPMKGE